jgi:hypothetical protein
LGSIKRKFRESQREKGGARQYFLKMAKIGGLLALAKKLKELKGGLGFRPKLSGFGGL